MAARTLSVAVSQAIGRIVEALRVPGVISGIYPQTKWAEATGERERLPGTFRTVLAVTVESLTVQSALRVLDHPLRRASGLTVAGVAPPALP